jgi:antitoxin component YwqK of YwqJK toxin-antitoxin module
MIHFIRDLVDDKIQGKVVEYYRSGKIKSVTNHHKSHYCGAYIEYFDNDSNTVKVQGEYKLNDSLEIDLSYLNKSNIEQGLISSVRYGKWTEYFENGNLKAHGMYYPLLVYEIDSVYIDNVFVTARRIPVFLKDGNWIYYDESGNVLKKEYYEKGALIE